MAELLVRVDYIMGPVVFGTDIPLDPDYIIMSTSLVH